MNPAWNRLLSELNSGSMSRRHFLATAVAMGFSVSAANRALADVPKRGGHLIMGIDSASSADTLNPITWMAAHIVVFGTQLYDTLVSVDEQMVAKPALVESWEPKPDLKEWVFKLRKNVTFHNGKSLTPADVIYSLNHHRGKDSKSSAKAVLSAVTEIKETAPNEITFTLETGNADFPYVLADWHLIIAPQESSFDGVGTGAFILESFEAGVRGRTRRNKNDWRQDRGYVDSVETIAINNPAARISALLSNSVHFINKIPVSAVAALEGSPNVQLLNGPALGFALMSMTVTAPPFDNLDLRLALKYGIDREAIIKTALRGYARVGNDQPVASIDRFFAKDIPQKKYDPDKARFYLKKSGYSGPVTFTVSEITFPGAVDAAQIFQQSASKAGIDFQINRVPSDGYYANIWKKVPFFSSYTIGRPTADSVLTTFFSSGSNSNDTGWKSPKLDQILISARAERDDTKRKQLYHDAQLLISDNGANIIPIFPDNIDAGSKAVRGYTPSPLGQVRGYRGAEDIWLAT